MLKKGDIILIGDKYAEKAHYSFVIGKKARVVHGPHEMHNPSLVIFEKGWMRNEKSYYKNKKLLSKEW